MADYPLPKFHFQVEWGGTKISFTEVTGLTVETEAIKYRTGDDQAYTHKQQPGLKKYGNVTMKRGTFESDNEYFKWWEETRLFQDDPKKFRRDVTVSLLGDDHKAIVTWKIINAWPVKVQSADLKADANEVAIESIEVIHEGITITNGN